HIPHAAPRRGPQGRPGRPTNGRPSKPFSCRLQLTFSQHSTATECRPCSVWTLLCSAHLLFVILSASTASRAEASTSCAAPRRAAPTREPVTETPSPSAFLSSSCITKHTFVLHRYHYDCCDPRHTFTDQPGRPP